jgi:hypothetical protein
MLSTLTDWTLRQLSSVSSAMVATTAMPALLTRQSSRP